jgi:hypothetical protein
MVSNPAARVQVTTRDGAVWRRCAACAVLAPLAPDETHCHPCRPSTASAVSSTTAVGGGADR